MQGRFSVRVGFVEIFQLELPEYSKHQKNSARTDLGFWCLGILWSLDVEASSFYPCFAIGQFAATRPL